MTRLITWEKDNCTDGKSAYAIAIFVEVIHGWPHEIRNKKFSER